MSGHTFLRCNICLVIPLNFCHDIRFLCRNRIHFNLMLCFHDIKLLCRDKVVLPSNADSEFCVMTELSFVTIKLFCHLSSLCRDIVVTCCDKVLSSGLSSAGYLLRHNASYCDRASVSSIEILS